MKILGRLVRRLSEGPMSSRNLRRALRITNRMRAKAYYMALDSLINEGIVWREQSGSRQGTKTVVHTTYGLTAEGERMVEEGEI